MNFMNFSCLISWAQDLLKSPNCILLIKLKSVTVVNAITNILLRFKLSIQHCRGQTYNGVSSMVGNKSEVGTKLLAEQPPKALVTHFQGHSLYMALQNLTECCKKLCDTMSTVREICVLVKYSPKHQNILFLEECKKIVKETLILKLINFQHYKSCTQLVGLFPEDHLQLLFSIAIMG